MTKSTTDDNDIMQKINPLGLAPLVHDHNFSRVSSEARANVQAQTQPAIEQQRQQTEQQAQKTLDKEAIAAIEETVKAVRALAANQTTEALAAIERASGKLDVVLARNPDTALVPVDVEVVVIDLAPRDYDEIMDLAGAASIAVDIMDFPDARSLLRSLMSEIRIRTYSLPLATYPTALKDAARLLDQKETQEASALLLTALGTLVETDQVQPLPLLLAREAVIQAQKHRDKDKSAAQALLEVARKELDRSRYLGYAGKDPEYESLQNEIKSLEQQLKGDHDTTSVFAKLKEKLDAFLKRQSAKHEADRQPPKSQKSQASASQKRKPAA
jgi:hypothetical protein